jgi:hypothetical protein
MTPSITADKTSRAGLEQQYIFFEWDAEADQTGWELGEGYKVVLYTNYLRHLQVAMAENQVPVEPAEDLGTRAAVLARAMPHRESVAPPAPVLSGNLAEDVHRIVGLSWKQIAAVFNITERAAAGWRVQGVPPHREATMEALRAIGTILVGGLGPDGVERWLTAGHPSRLERLREGEVQAVAEEARSYLDGPAG